MILEVAVLDVRAGLERDFEAAFAQASPIIASMPGYVSHQLQRCVETANRYLLLVNWKSLEAHTVGFRGSAEYQRWKQLLHHFYDPFPTVEHYALVHSARPGRPRPEDYGRKPKGADVGDDCIAGIARSRSEPYADECQAAQAVLQQVPRRARRSTPKLALSKPARPRAREPRRRLPRGPVCQLR